MISFLVFLFIIGILIVVHEFGHFIVAKRSGVRVERFSLGFGPRLLSRKKGDTEYILSAIPLGGYVKLAGDIEEECKGGPGEFLSKSPGKRARVIFAGAFLNYLLGFLCFWIVFCVGYPMFTTKVGGLVGGYGAEEAGVLVNDRIIAVDGRKVSSWEDLQRSIQERKDNTAVRLSVRRNDAELIVDVKIRSKQFDDAMGVKRRVGLLGITPADEIVAARYNVAESFVLAAETTFELTTMTYQALWRMLSGRLSLRESTTGFVGIYYMTSKFVPLGFSALLRWLALLSISLAIFNLLPLPVLDGGHLALLAVEKVRGRRLGARAERFMTQLGLALIITLALVVTYNDIARFFGEKIAQWFR